MLQNEVKVQTGLCRENKSPLRLCSHQYIAAGQLSFLPAHLLRLLIECELPRLKGTAAKSKLIASGCGLHDPGKE